MGRWRDPTKYHNATIAITSAEIEWSWPFLFPVQKRLLKYVEINPRLRVLVSSYPDSTCSAGFRCSFTTSFVRPSMSLDYSTAFQHLAHWQRADRLIAPLPSGLKTFQFLCRLLPKPTPGGQINLPMPLKLSRRSQWWWAFRSVYFKRTSMLQTSSRCWRWRSIWPIG